VWSMEYGGTPYGVLELGRHLYLGSVTLYRAVKGTQGYRQTQSTSVLLLLSNFEPHPKMGSSSWHFCSVKN